MTRAVILATKRNTMTTTTASLRLKMHVHSFTSANDEDSVIK